MEEDGNLFKKMKQMFTVTREEQEDVAEEIISMVDEKHEQGFFAGSEAEMIRNVFEYGDKNAKDIMTHRKNIIALDGEESTKDALAFILEQNYSRFPVYEGEIDNIVGTIHLRDAVKCYFDEKLRGLPIKELKGYVRDVIFIPETKNIDSLFKQMQSEQNHMAIVIDEYGQTSGIVTMEDILEEIFGNIQDEYDEEEESIVLQNDGTYLVKGMTELEDLERIFDLSFEKEDFDTLNGFLIDELDHIPSTEEACAVSYQGYCFQILSVEDNMIQSVRVGKIPLSQ
ncbi:MAG: hemolysin family protein [Lachnospiraceae bacterium]